MKNLKMILIGQRPLKDVWHYLVGNYRYRLYFKASGWSLKPNYFGWLLRTHIREQIRFRCQYVPNECWNSGACVKCGCQVPHLQMAFKSCDGDCYPELMSSKEWKAFKKGGTIKQKDKIWCLNIATNMLTLMKIKNGDHVSEYRPKLR